jgi:hypothetical protein
MKSKNSIFKIWWYIGLGFLLGCEEKLVIYIDELSEAYTDKIIRTYQAKYPSKNLEIWIYNTDFIFQSIKMGRLPDVIVSLDTSYAQKFNIKLPKKKLIDRDALVLVKKDSIYLSMNDLLTKGKYIALPMQSSALYPICLKYLEFKKISDELIKIYPHDFQSMSMMIEKNVVQAGIMLKSQADKLNLQGISPYFHQSLIHYVVEFE